MLGCSKVMLQSGCLPTTKISSDSFSDSSDKAGLSSRKMFLRIALFFSTENTGIFLSSAFSEMSSLGSSCFSIVECREGENEEKGFE